MAKIILDLEPWTIPNYVRTVPKPGLRQDGFTVATDKNTISLEDCTWNTLNAMCNEFRANVFKRAKIEDVKDFPNLTKGISE